MNTHSSLLDPFISCGGERVVNTAPKYLSLIIFGAAYLIDVILSDVKVLRSSLFTRHVSTDQAPNNPENCVYLSKKLNMDTASFADTKKSVDL